jgi:hypothetical protein
LLDYPIDTNIFISAKYDFSPNGIFSILLGYIRDGKIKLYISDIVEHEVKKHLEDEFSKVCTIFKKARNESTEKISNNLVKQMKFSYLFDNLNKDAIVSEALSVFQKYINDSKAVILDNSNVDCNQIISDYFEGNPPFANSDKKKFEFPDAIMIAKLKMVFNEENSVIVVSNDNKFREAVQNHNGVRTFQSLKEVFDLINKEQEKTYADIIQFLSQSSTKAELCKEIQVALDRKNLDIDGMDCDRKGYCEGYDYEEVYIDSIENVDFEFKSVDEITSNTVKITVTVTALISAICSFYDIDNSIWDPEENEYFYSERISIYEEHEPKFECELIFEIKNKLEDAGISLELKTVDLDLTLNQYTRISREIIPSSDPAEDAKAEEMEAMEEYYKH